MKKHLKVINTLLILGSLSLVSCFKSEAPNAECDILEAILRVDKNKIKDTFYHPSDSLVKIAYSSNQVTFTVRQGVDLSRMTPVFHITEGATISPESGSMQDFSKGKIKYTVTSESGEWQREYWVGFASSKMIPEFEFEIFDLEPKKRFYLWYSRLDDGKTICNWASGNEGFAMNPGDATPEEYPTSPDKHGVSGHCLKLTTKSTGSMGTAFKKPIAGGSLWLGEFDGTKALSKPMESIRFGVPFDRKPLKLTGYYKYMPGPKMTDKEMKPIPGKTDQPDIFAILFINHNELGEPVCLFSDNAKTSPQLVGIAQVENLGKTENWKEFQADFRYLKPIDPDLLAAQGYSLSIMFNSSIDGNTFVGAVGSELCIDRVKLVCEEK